MSNLSSILAPLYRLLRKNNPWKWSQDQTDAFVKAKELLQSSSVLVHFDPANKLFVFADASPYGLGAIMSHKMEDGSEHPISFASHTLSNAERKYSQIKKEALALIFAVKSFTIT